MKTTFCVLAVAMTLGPSAAYAEPFLDVVPIAGMPKAPPPGEMEKFSPANAVIDANGDVFYKDPRKHSDFRRGLDVARSLVDGKADAGQPDKQPPQGVRDIGKLRLAFHPKQHGNGHELLVASPAGTLTDEGWSGLERHVRIPNAGVYKLVEFDLSKTGGKFYLASEATNALIENSPAGTKSFVDENDNVIEEVVWVSGGRFHLLTYAPDTQVSREGKRKKKAVTVSAASIAQELRN